MKWPFLLLLVGGLSLAGCGGGGEHKPELVEVTGIVTLDGEPLSKATVIYFPEADGRTSSGVTNDEGKYQLMYEQYQPGAIPGRHRVEIRTGGEMTDKDGNILSETKEILPAKYHAKSQLTAEVTAPTNDVPFDLVSR